MAVGRRRAQRGPPFRLRTVRYGCDSVEALVQAALRVNESCAGLSGDAALAARQAVLDSIDRRGILATPANSSINELVIEAARLSIQRDGLPAQIQYAPTPSVRLRA